MFRSLVCCILMAPMAQAAYPEEWWTPVPPESAASWEILPQAAGPGEVILSKRTSLGILSNFAATEFELQGEKFASVEGFWQMMKYPEGPNDERNKVAWPHTRKEVAQMTAFEAKKAGSEANELMKKLGIEWVTFQGQKINYLENKKGAFYRLIFDAQMAKVLQNPKVCQILLQTGDLKLRPDHQQAETVAPAWKYFEIWMDIRAQFQKKPDFKCPN